MSTLLKTFLVIVAALTLASCADSVAVSEAIASMPLVGFWYGLWHGMILPFAWIGSLFSDNIAIYAVYNNGGWYDFGYVLGCGGLTRASVSYRNK